jgi:hypothetical protein
MYRVVHTGPNIQLGGFQDGLMMVGYQVVTESRVKNPLKLPKTKQQMAEKTIFLSLESNISVERFFQRENEFAAYTGG